MRIGIPVTGVMVRSDILSDSEGSTSLSETHASTILLDSANLDDAMDMAMLWPFSSEYSFLSIPADLTIWSSVWMLNSWEFSIIFTAEPLTLNLESSRTSEIASMAFSIMGS